MNCPNCGARSRTNGIAKLWRDGERVEHQESNYRMCPKCRTRWTEHRRIVPDSVKLNKHSILGLTT